MQITFTQQEREYLDAQLEAFIQTFSACVLSPVLHEFRIKEMQNVSTLACFNEELRSLREQLRHASDSALIELDEKSIPLLKCIILTQRRKVASNVEERRM